MSDFSNVAHMVAATQAKPQPNDQPHVRKLFMLLHGAYGNPFIAKFSSGERDADGKDKGIRSAMMVWGHGLLDFAPDVVEAAAKRYTMLYPEFPPNLPQFEAVCRSMVPRKTFAEEQGLKALPAPTQSRADVALDVVGDGRDWARRILAGVDAGDRRSPTVVRFAREALRVGAA